MFRYDQLAEKKSMLLSIIVFSVVALLSFPIILPNIFHGTHILHILLHIAGIIVAIFLTMVSAIAYSKIKTRRLFFTMIAFSIFIAAESLSVVDATWPFTFYLGGISFVETSHILLIVMLGIFMLAVFRKD